MPLWQLVLSFQTYRWFINLELTIPETTRQPAVPFWCIGTQRWLIFTFWKWLNSGSTHRKLLSKFIYELYWSLHHPSPWFWEPQHSRLIVAVGGGLYLFPSIVYNFLEKHHSSEFKFGDISFSTNYAAPLFQAAVTFLLSFPPHALCILNSFHFFAPPTSIWHFTHILNFCLMHLAFIF